MKNVSAVVAKKKTVVLVGMYMPGIYPPGDFEAVTDFISIAFLKATADADLQIASEYEIKTFNFPTSMDPQEMASQICAETPVIVGYSVYMWNVHQMLSSADSIKQAMPKTTILLGGPQVSYDSQNLLKKHPQIDLVVSGSGEIRFKQILKSDLSPESLSKIPKVTYRDMDGKVIQSSGVPYEDVSQIPSPYVTKAINLDDGNRHVVFLETARGCAFKCAYCIWGQDTGKLNKFDLDQVLAEIEIIYNHPKVELVYLTDACLFYTKKRAKVICDKIASCSRGKEIPTLLSMDIRVLNEDVIEHLNKIKLERNQFHFGLQTINPLALELQNRKTTMELFQSKVDLLRKVKPDAEMSFDLIYGLPGDNFSEFRNTVNFAFSLNSNKLYYSHLLLLPGTPFWDKKEEFELDFDEKPPYMLRSNKYYSRQDMEKTYHYVLWLLAIQCSPLIRDLICEIPRVNKKYQWVDVIDLYIECLSTMVDPISIVEFDYDAKGDEISNSMLDTCDDVKFDFTIAANNLIRRKVLDILAKPENCLNGLQAVLKVIKDCDVEGLMADKVKDIEIGIDYYRAITKQSDNHEVAFLDKYGTDRMQYVRNSWVTATAAAI